MKTKNEIKKFIEEGRAVLGVEFGSTRIKTVLIGEDFTPVAQGDHEWENQLEDGIWTYSLGDVWSGIQDAYRGLKADVKEKYGTDLVKLGCVGISAMMHGYLAFDEKGELLVPFRTWRNTITEEASEKLTKLFGYHIPQRWSIAHLYQAILNGEPHVSKVRFITTLSGYVHWKLTGQKVIGVGDASGMFPIDPKTADYNPEMIQKFDGLIEPQGFSWKLEEILPKSLKAGEYAGTLTQEGAKLLDPSGALEAGVRFASPEGDAGTGMTATNSVAVRTGNVSAGTSVFSMVVLEKPLSKVYPELDLVTTPTGSEVAMVHCNNCTSDLNAWMSVFDEFCDLAGLSIGKGELYSLLYRNAMKGDPGCGDVLSYNFVSGEPVAGVMDQEGAPMVVRTASSKFTLSNLFRSLIYSAFGTLKIGNDILMKQEHVRVDRLMGHGGIFKTKGVAQNILAAALGAPVTCMETAGEGGPWGMALLASYCVNNPDGLSLSDWLDKKVFANASGETVSPDPAEVAGFDRWIGLYRKGLEAEKAAIKAF